MILFCVLKSFKKILFLIFSQIWSFLSTFKRHYFKLIFSYKFQLSQTESTKRKKEKSAKKPVQTLEISKYSFLFCFNIYIFMHIFCCIFFLSNFNWIPMMKPKLCFIQSIQSRICFFIPKFQRKLFFKKDFFKAS